MKKRVADHGRDPHQVRILPAATVVVGESDGDAQRKHQDFADRVHPLAGLSRLAYHVNVDLTQYDLDGPLPDLGEVGVQGHYDEVREFAQREKLSIREIGRWYGARTEGNMVGSVDSVVDTMEQWLDRGAADGFMIQATHLPGAFEEFARYVVPELQRRGLHKTEYQGATAREHFGLPRPARDAWQHRALRGEDERVIAFFTGRFCPMAGRTRTTRGGARLFGCAVSRIKWQNGIFLRIPLLLTAAPP
ncbi:hypothetical protein [Pantoea rodasii]|uniref:hypothetical protein n=1 Tax=Pantoea rodasii TaxID=1076549 RepID=UPI001FCD891F|nr:hypothetical protein [Pantoea rodasii]